MSLMGIGMQRLAMGIAGMGMAVSAFAGCAPQIPALYGTPRTPTVEIASHFPQELEYELLAATRATACATHDELEMLRHHSDGKKDDQVMSTSSALFERAKFEAIERVPEADNLMFIRSRLDTYKEGDKQCVTVVGRAYRVRMRGTTPAPRALP